MTRGFRPGPHGTAVVRLDSRERLALRQLLFDLQRRLGTRAAGGPPGARRRPPGPPADEFEALVAGIDPEVPSVLEPPHDPVLARLLPDAYPEDVEGGVAAAEFRRFTEPELRATKSEAAQAVLDALADERTPKLSLDRNQAEAWLIALNDLRLALGVLLGVTEDNDRRRHDITDPLYARFNVYDWLTFLQASLIEVLAH
ncbi:MAG: DUF2017 domain-containing protein [Mycobacteriales bacterium]